MKRILLMESGSFRTFGGAAKATYDIYNFLKRFEGYDVDFYADFSQDGSAKSITKHDLESKTYDVVLLNSIRDVPVVLSHVRKASKHAKYIYTDRGNVLLNFRNAKLKRLLPKMVARRHFMLQMRKWLDCYVAISGEQYEYAKDFFHKHTRIEFVPIAPARHFKKTAVKRKEDYAIYVGRLDERQKRVGFLISGLRRVKELHKDIAGRYLLRIIGTGPHEKQYKKLVKVAGLEKNVVFEGFVDENELVRSYSASKFFVSTSEWEGMSRTFVEAMACGLPLLVNNKNNTSISYKPGRRIVEHNFNGMVYEYGSIGDFADKFYAMYTGNRMREKLARNAYDFSKNFSLEKNLKGYKAIIDSL